MTSLAPLHRRLRRLVRRRRRLRWLAGLTPLATAVLWFLGVAFALDWLLDLNRAQRLVIWLAGAAGLLWAYRRYGWPWVQGKESELDVALWVERRARVDTDVVAALQFESPEAPSWGSVQLEQAVMEQAAQLAPQLPMDEGLPKKPIRRRTVVFACTAAAAFVVWAIWPEYVQIFLSRLLLSSRHYPTRTQIQWVKVNGQIVPPDSGECWVVEGQPLRIEVLATGQLPEEGRVELALQSTGARTRLPLQPASPGQPGGQPGSEDSRSSQSKTPHQLGSQPETSRPNVPSQPKEKALPKEDLQKETPLAKDSSLSDEQAFPKDQALPKEESLPKAQPLAQEQSLPKAQKQPGGSEGTVYIGGLDQLSDQAWMKIYLGDAWTEPILLRLTPLPRIELLMEVQPPEYALEADVPKGRFPGLCQLAVVEGSQVQVYISSDKHLQEAHLQIEDKTYPMRRAEAAETLPTASAGGGRTEAAQRPSEQAEGGASGPTGQSQWWTLPPVGTPLEAVTTPLQFTIQVKDEHHLSLEHPVQGFLRILPDLPPRVSASQRTPRILPTARPRIIYEATDDFGIGKVSLLRQVIRPDGSSEEDELVVYQKAAGEKPTKTRQATVQVPLDSLRLKPGDQLRLTVRVEDYRGPRPGQVGLSEPLLFQVTDLAGILAAITEADRQLVQEYQEMIDRQLEVGGEKP